MLTPPAAKKLLPSRAEAEGNGTGIHAAKRTGHGCGAVRTAERRVNAMNSTACSASGCLPPPAYLPFPRLLAVRLYPLSDPCPLHLAPALQIYRCAHSRKFSDLLRETFFSPQCILNSTPGLNAFWVRNRNWEHNIADIFRGFSCAIFMPACASKGCHLIVMSR